MRIRKHASKLLASSLLLQQSTTATTSAAASGNPPCDAAVATAAASALLTASSSSSSPANGHSSPSACSPKLRAPVLNVCQLNRSPWDVMPSSPFVEYQSQQNQNDEETHQEGGEEEEYGFVTMGNRNGINGREGISPVKNSALILPKDEVLSEGMEEYSERGREKQKHKQQQLRKTTTKKKNSRKRVKREPAASWVSTKEEVVEDEEESATAAICKKSDGKGWHCKREAKHPYSLCDYHLSQIRAYYHSTHHLQPHRLSSKPKASPAVNGTNFDDKKKVVAVTAAPAKKKSKRKTGSKKDGPEFIYYYSTFGPWRGKRRWCEGGGQRKEMEAMGGVDDTTTTVDAAAAASSLVVHDEVEGDDDDDLDPESIDDVEDSSDDVGPVKRRRGRKPIKARSLKSLL